MLITHIYLVTNGDEKKAYATPSGALGSLEGAGLRVIECLIKGGSRYCSVESTQINREFLSSLLASGGYLDFAGNNCTHINRIKLNSGDTQAVLIPEGADIEDY